MAVEILTATAVNGIITPARGTSSLGLIERLAVPREVLDRQAELRRRHDAVVVGSGTVLVDDPSLTSHAGPGQPAVRATLDPGGRIPAGARFLDGTARTLIGVTGSTPQSYLDLLAARGVEAVPCRAPGSRPAVEQPEQRADLALFVAGLAARGLSRLLVEGGGRLNRGLLADGLVDRLHLLVFPAVLDAASINLFDGPGELVRLHLECCERLGGYLHLTYLVLRGVR
ncbi:MAG TPA: dihydrofolate reductase family protein [Thermoanaerobaculia bacterium]|nr:dihydrofolate reductase family protein [Thermoanaerobaculia bacterium]